MIVTEEINKEGYQIANNNCMSENNDKDTMLTSCITINRRFATKLTLVL